MSNKNNKIEYYYQFKFEDGRCYSFTIQLLPDRLKIIKLDREGLERPEWTKMGFHRCEICSLDEQEFPYCPVAENLTEIIETFKNITSIEKVEALARTPEREVRCNLPIQKALSSLIGIYMAAGGCLVLKKFSPLVKFHLPFATVEETMYRTISNYLLAQFFISKGGGRPDWKLEGLKKFYNKVEIINIAMCKRLNAASLQDANINAVIILDIFVKSVTHLMDNVLEDIKPLYEEDIKEAVLLDTINSQ